MQKMLKERNSSFKRETDADANEEEITTISINKEWNEGRANRQMIVTALLFSPDGYIPRLESKEWECWKLLDWRLNQHSITRDYWTGIRK